MPVTLPLSTSVSPSEVATGFIGHGFPLVRPCWLSPDISLFSICLSLYSRRICSMILQSSEVRLMGLYFSRYPTFPFIKMEVMFALFQSVGTLLYCYISQIWWIVAQLLHPAVPSGPADVSHHPQHFSIMFKLHINSRPLLPGLISC